MPLTVRTRRLVRGRDRATMKAFNDFATRLLKMNINRPQYHALNSSEVAQLNDIIASIVAALASVTPV